MKIMIPSDSLRKDGKVVRFLVMFPELGTGYHGVQINLPATAEDVKAAVKKCYQEVKKQVEDTNALRAKYSSLLDTEIELSD
ncbi:MAG: hypothetical protein ACTSUO_08565 [Candidatus Thorarchaeota archaeon]